MTADEALALAAYQRPGVKFVVGPELAREEPVVPLSAWRVSQIKNGDASWWDRDMRLQHSLRRKK